MTVLKTSSAVELGTGVDLLDDLEQPPPPFEQLPPGPPQCLLINPSDNNIQFTSTSGANPNIEAPPPDFSPYHAEYFETSSGDIVSHDPHLNTDGEALYRFLLSQANRSPSYRLHCRGTHSEYRTRWIRETNSEGRAESRRETFTETVTDFDFYIDTGPPLSYEPIHWSVADSEPAYRGLMVQETELCGVRRTTRGSENKSHNRWAEERKVLGLPPWITSIDEWFEGLPDDSNKLRSSRSLRQWADEYCASPKYLKEFKYEKILYGWNLQKLESAVRSAIQSTMYHGLVEVEIKTFRSRILIRPDNRLSRMLSNKWLKFLSILLFIFPLIWLFKRFHPRGGGRWEVCGGAYALKHWVLAQPEDVIDSGFAGSRVEQYAISTRFRQTPDGMTRVVGLTEWEWFRIWQPRIIQGVIDHYQSSTPILNTGDHNS
ncbi:hypothetical protein BDZ94DRAFT_1176407 [Collybia nuda]|uniref:Uncharacterized protein n=1 Tax=Collybia nuda TaxID=64659 RepID=A0A9P6CDH5_9AGAR|nr:hypothetical protein BDZ94DRAFT_1176407 [Collybia nuda]